ncbi:hypothetical protein GQ457_03G010750 [Hibiscus cannabinus]
MGYSFALPKSLILFSKSIGFFDVASAKLLAIKETVYLFRELLWLPSFQLIIETDCFSCEIQLISRVANVTADRLAKSGIQRERPFVWNVGSSSQSNV